MKQILAFRPGVAASGTAFEAMAKIYKYLQQNYNYKFTIITSQADDYSDENLNIVTVPDSVNKYSSLISQFINRIPPSWTVSSQIEPYFKQADAVLTLDPTTFIEGEVGIRMAIDSDVPVWFDSGRTKRRPWLGPKWKVRRRILTGLIEEVSGIIATSPKVLERFREVRVFNSEIASKISLMGHPVDTEIFNQDDRNNRVDDNTEILTIGRLVPEKGHYYVLEALAPILRNQEDVTWKIVGDGPMKGLLETEIANRDISDSVNMCGTIPHSEVPTILCNADIFVNHSVNISQWEEFFGAANIEAMACKLPCVLTDSGSIPYVMREDNICYIVSQRNIVGLRDKIRYLLESPQRREEIGQNARQFVVNEYSVTAIGEKYRTMLEKEEI